MYPWQFAIFALIMSKTEGELNLNHWHDWDKYQVIMWSTGEPRDLPTWFDRLREMECTAEECYSGRNPEPFIKSDFGFYVENLIPELAFLHSRRKLYDDDFQGYTATQDKKFLIRKPCFNDPAFWDEVKPRIQRLVRPFVPNKPLLYNLRDELSICSFASPMDYCFGTHTIEAFREWLKTQYNSLAGLNIEWETSFTSWDQVMPMTTYEIKDSERKALKGGKLENYSPWADHRAFMDITFAQALGRMRNFIRELDPDTPVGIEGTQMPSAWGGYDLWQLSKVIDWIEPYDIACSRKIFRSFLPSYAPVLGTVFGNDFNRIKRKLWWLLLNGDRGCIIWDDEKSRCVEKDEESLPLTERGMSLSPIFSELKSIAPKLFKLQRLDDRIAIHYSQASIRAHWMFDSRDDKDTWPRRFSSYEAKHSRLAQVRDSFLRVIEDLGFQCNFVSYEQIENGELINGGYKVLVLPQSVAMSKMECEQIDAFVHAGGMVIADNMTATMDEHCKRLANGQLDELFGIQRSEVGLLREAKGVNIPTLVDEAIPLQAYETDISLTTSKTDYNAPIVIENKVGKGRAVYLNLDMHRYSQYRLSPPKGDNYQILFRQMLQSAGIEAPVKILDAKSNKPSPCVEVWRYQDSDSEYIAFMRNAEFDADSLGHTDDHDNVVLEKKAIVNVIFSRALEIEDIRTGKNFSTTNKIIVELDPWGPTIIKLRKKY
jgi:hypothetical protein